MLNILNKDLYSKTGKQTIILFLSQILALALVVLVGSINTRTFGIIDYGVFTFFFTFTDFTTLFFHFGFSSSAGLLLAETRDVGKEKELIGATIIIAFFVGLTYSIFMYISSFFVDILFHTTLGWIFRYASFLVVLLPFTLFFPQIARGTNQIILLSIFNIIPKVIYIFSALVFLNLIQIQPIHFILLNLSCTLIGVLIILYILNPRYSNLSKNLEEIFSKTKEYGFYLYIGQIADQATYKLDGIFITLFVNTIQLGFYSLALMLTSPIAAMSQALSTSLFKHFVVQNRIPRKVILYTSIWSGFCVLALIIICPFLISTLFGDEFLPTRSLIPPLALAGFFQGMYQPYNMFFGAKGKGKWMRNMSIAMAIVNLIGNIVLIPLLGAMGAAIASLLGTGSFFFASLYYYKKFLNTLVVDT